MGGNEVGQAPPGFPHRSNGMSRDQSDAVALAVDNHWPSRTASKGPLENRTFVKNCIASGSLVPPIGEGASVRRTDLLVGWAVIVLGACGVVAMAVAFLWRA